MKVVIRCIFVLSLSLSIYAQRAAWKPLEKDARIGHGSMVYSAAFSPDSKYLASYDEAGSIVVWDLASRQQRYRIEDTESEGYEKPIFSPDGRILAAVVERHDEPTILLESTIRFWDAATGKAIGSLEGSYRIIDEMIFSPDSKTLFAAIDQKVTNIWDATTLKRKTATLASVGPYAFNAQGTQMAATAVSRKSLILFDARTGKTVRTIPGFRFVVSIGFAPSGKFLAVNDEEAAAGRNPGGMRLKVWNLTTGRRVPGFDSVDSHPPVAFIRGGSSLLLLQFEKDFAEEPGETSTIGSFFYPADGKQQGTLTVDFPLNGFGTGFSSDGRLLAVRSGSSITTTVPESEIRVIDTHTGKLHASLPGYRRGVTSLAFTSDGRELVSAHPNGRLIAWNTSTWSSVSSLAVETDYMVPDDIKLLPGLKTFAVGGGVSQIHDLSTGKPVHDSTDEKFETYLAVSGDGRLMMTTDREVSSFYTVPEHELRNSLPIPIKMDEGPPVSIALDNSGEKIAYGHDSAVTILDSRSGKQLSKFTIPKGTISGITFASDGKYIGLANSEAASTTNRFTINVLEVGTGKVLLSLKTDEAGFEFSPDSSMIASLNESDRLLLTRISDGRTLAESKVVARKVGGPVYIAFHPSRRLAAVGTRYGIQVFDTETGEQVARIR